jgi:hypothetical protein
MTNLQEQVTAARGVGIEWHFAEDITMKEFKEYVQRRNPRTVEKR